MFSKKKYNLYSKISVSGLILIIFGSVFVLSSSFSYGMARNDPIMYFERHILYLIIGIAGVFLIDKIGIRKLEKLSTLIFFISLIILPLPKFMGSLRWIRLGPLSFQPAELVKFTFIFFLANYLKKRELKVNDFKVIIIPVVLWLIITGILQIQKDFGTFVIITFVFIGILFFCGFKWKYLLGIGGIIGILCILLVIIFPYRIDRIKIFLNPEADPLGKGYQVKQAKIAISSGGLLGKGLGAGIRKLKFLPEAHKDYVFAVVGEETGFVGTTAVLILFAIIVFSGFEVSRLTKDIFDKIVALGISILFGVQFFLHSGVVVGILPPKGTTLPFFSVGGSSLVINLLALGVLLEITKNIANERDINDIDERFLKI